MQFQVKLTFLVKLSGSVAEAEIEKLLSVPMVPLDLFKFNIKSAGVAIIFTEPLPDKEPPYTIAVKL